jgi:hypothetical protein
MTGRRLPGLDQPQETRFFMIIAGWALALGIIYWLVSRELAGTALLAGLALATGAMAAWLIRGRRATPMEGRGDRRPVVPEGGTDAAGAGTAGVDRPFQDDEGRLPDPTLGPFALGLGIALAATGPVFGLAPVVVGAVSLIWGAWTWLAAARDEHDALRAEDRADDPA